MTDNLNVHGTIRTRSEGEFRSDLRVKSQNQFITVNQNSMTVKEDLKEFRARMLEMIVEYSEGDDLAISTNILEIRKIALEYFERKKEQIQIKIEKEQKELAGVNDAYNALT